jgi:lysophospholipase L1-like esterase
MKILVLADSLALPRQEGEGGIAYENTYPYLLELRLRRSIRNDIPIIIERGMRLRTIEDVLQDWFEMVELRSPDVILIHVGIVDCAPRIFLRRERRFVERLRPAVLRQSILNFVHKHRSTIIRRRPRVYVPPERFRDLVTQVMDKAERCRLRSLVFVTILMPPESLERRSPGFMGNVRIYNQILQELAAERGARLIDINAVIGPLGGTDKLTVDGIHLNEAGHALLATEIERHIMNLVKGSPSETTFPEFAR